LQWPMAARCPISAASSPAIPERSRVRLLLRPAIVNGRFTALWESAAAFS